MLSNAGVGAAREECPYPYNIDREQSQQMKPKVGDGDFTRLEMGKPGNWVLLRRLVEP